MYLGMGIRADGSMQMQLNIHQLLGSMAMATKLLFDSRIEYAGLIYAATV